MSDFTSKVSSKGDYDLFVQNKNDKDINKVLLFTKKEKVTPVFKALSAEFRDKVRFSVIALPDKKETKDNLALKEEYNITDLPTVILEQTYSIKDKQVLDTPSRLVYNSKTYKIPELVRFIKPFARADQKAELEATAE